MKSRFIKGITVTLYTKTQTGVDGFNNPIYSEIETPVENVLISPVLSDDATSTLQLSGKYAKYELSIPKGDTHNWVDCKIMFFGEVWRSIGYPEELIEALVPLDWNKKVKVERYG